MGFGIFLIGCNLFSTVSPTLPPQLTATVNRFPTLPPTSTSLPPIALTPRVTPTTLTTQPPNNPTTQPPTPTVISNQLSVTGHIVFTCFIDSFDNICLMDGDGKNSKRFTQTKATDFYPSLSPDGKMIAFSSRRTGNFEIYLMNADGSNPRAITQGLGSCFAPNFSPDGKKIAFVVADEKSVQHIYVMGADGDRKSVV